MKTKSDRKTIVVSLIDKKEDRVVSCGRFNTYNDAKLYFKELKENFCAGRNSGTDFDTVKKIGSIYIGNGMFICVSDM